MSPDVVLFRPAAEAEVKPPAAAEVAETPVRVEAAASELSVETSAQMTLEAKSRFGRLPERQKGMFAGLRERFSRKKDPTEQVRSASEYHQAQREVVRDAESQLVKTQKEQEAARQEAEAAGKRKVEIGHATASVEALLDDSALDVLGRKKLEEIIKDTKKREEAEFKKVNEQHRLADERANRELARKIENTQKSIERYKGQREKASDRLDDTVIKAMNGNAEQGVDIEADLQGVKEQLSANQEASAKLDAAATALDAKLKGVKEPLVIESLKQLITQTKAEQAKLKEVGRRLTDQKGRQEKLIGKLETKNGQLVPYLSLKKVEQLLDDSEHGWVIPMLSADQVVNLSEERQREILTDNQENQKALLPKLKDAQLKKLSEAGIIPDKETLLAQGILKPVAEVKPIEEARAARAAKVEAAAVAPESAEAEHKTLTIGEWRANIKDAVAKAGSDARGIDLPEDIEIFDIPSEDIIDIGSDQAVAAAKTEAKGDETKEESLIRKVLKEFAKMLEKLFKISIDEAEGFIESGLTGRPRTKFDSTIEAWNKTNSGPKISMEDVPRELHGQDLSEASAKLKLAELVKKQEGGDPAKVSEFFEHRKQEVDHAPAAAEAAAA